MQFFKYTLPWISGFFNGLFISPSKEVLLEELLLLHKAVNQQDYVRYVADEAWSVFTFSNDKDIIQVLSKVVVLSSFVIDALQTFLTKPSAILRGLHQQRESKQARTKMFLSPENSNKEEQTLLFKSN